mmetsp:Transcript_43581/g.114961  ORF Transcript_43581/g.114961 Transcript_43581/m.114961 type:complete len:258 (-) Transcript_43581:9-782(-)
MRGPNAPTHRDVLETWEPAEGGLCDRLRRGGRAAASTAACAIAAESSAATVAARSATSGGRCLRLNIKCSACGSLKMPESSIVAHKSVSGRILNSNFPLLPTAAASRAFQSKASTVESDSTSNSKSCPLSAWAPSRLKYSTRMPRATGTPGDLVALSGDRLRVRLWPDCLSSCNCPELFIEGPPGITFGNVGERSSVEGSVGHKILLLCCFEGGGTTRHSPILPSPVVAMAYWLAPRRWRFCLSARGAAQSDQTSEA